MLELHYSSWECTSDTNIRPYLDETQAELEALRLNEELGDNENERYYVTAYDVVEL